VRPNPSNRISLWDGYKFAVAGSRNEEIGSPFSFLSQLIGERPSVHFFDPFDTGIFWYSLTGDSVGTNCAIPRIS
jgi:hypothetical protein